MTAAVVMTTRGRTHYVGRNGRTRCGVIIGSWWHRMPNWQHPATCTRCRGAL